jgi:small-conductance mechanosensitive channel
VKVEGVEHMPKLFGLLAGIFFAYLVTGCQATPTPSAATTTPAPTLSSFETAVSTVTPTSSTNNLSVQGAATAVAARTPLPTPTPGIIDRGVEQITDQLGLTGKIFLGLTIYGWINLAISGLIILAGYVVANLLVNTVLKRLVKRSDFQFDDQFLSAIENPLRWLIVAFIARFAVLRLAGLNEGLRTFFDNVFFVVILIIASLIVARLISLSTKSYIGSIKSGRDPKSLAQVVSFIQRTGYFFLVILAVSIGLDHFGFNITVLAAILLVAGGLIALGARDTVENAVIGFTILLDQPFRVGDDVLIHELGTWGKVLEVGTLITRIRTRDNREVILPNSKISQNLITNYSLPDPRLRVETQIGVAYGSDFNKVRKVIEDAVRSVDGVLADKPVSIYFSEYGDSSRTMIVRWWVNSRADKNPILSKVNEALELALTKAGIVLPNNTMDLNVNMSGSQPDQQKVSGTDAK